MVRETMLFLSRRFRGHRRKDMAIMFKQAIQPLARQCHSFSACYNASQIGYTNISICMLLRPASLGIGKANALAGWVFSMAILVSYIRMLVFVEDGYELQKCA